MLLKILPALFLAADFVSGVCALSVGSVQFPAAAAQTMRLPSRLEYIHEGNLRLKEIVYSGENPDSTFSKLDYNIRLKMTDNQVNIRRC